MAIFTYRHSMVNNASPLITRQYFQYLSALQVLDLSQTPDLETPQYTVLKVTRDYEVRSYQPFVVAEAPMGPGSSELSCLGCCTRAPSPAAHMQPSDIAIGGYRVL